MERRKQILAAVLLLAAGVGAGIVFRPWILWGLRTAVPRTDAQWVEQVRADASMLARDVLRPDRPLEVAAAPEFRKVWDAQREAYPAERLRDLRAALGVYFDFLVAEAADCAEIYRVGSGTRPERRSDAAEAARRALRTALGEPAATLEAEADGRRETAFQASPKTAGYTEDLPDFRQEYADVLAWIPLARAAADELTQPLR